MDGHAVPGSGLLLTTWQTPTLGFQKQEDSQDRVYWRMFTKHSATHSWWCMLILDIHRAHCAVIFAVAQLSCSCLCSHFHSFAVLMKMKYMRHTLGFCFTIYHTRRGRSRGGSFIPGKGKNFGERFPWYSYFLETLTVKQYHRCNIPQIGY